MGEMEKENNLFITEISHLPYLCKKIIFIIIIIFFKKAQTSKATYSGFQKSTRM